MSDSFYVYSKYKYYFKKLTELRNQIDKSAYKKVLEIFSLWQQQISELLEEKEKRITELIIENEKLKKEKEDEAANKMQEVKITYQMELVYMIQDD